MSKRRSLKARGQSLTPRTQAALFCLLTGLAPVFASHAQGAEQALRVRASEAVAPCTAAAARAFEASTAQKTVVETGGLLERAPADVLVASSVEMTRALEADAAAPGTEVDVARIPWVLSVPSASAGAHDVAAVLRSAQTVWILGGPAAYEARRALRELTAERVRESTDPRLLREASTAVLPLSLAGPGLRLPLGIAPLVARAAVSSKPLRPEGARAFVRYLTSEPGQTAFASCAPAR